MNNKKVISLLGALYAGYTIIISVGSLSGVSSFKGIFIFLWIFFSIFTLFYLWILVKYIILKRVVCDNLGDILEIFDNKLIVTSKNGKKEILNNKLENELLISSCDFTKIIINCNIGRLAIDNCPRLTVVYSIFDVSYLHLDNCDNLSELLGFQQTRKLCINYCPRVKTLSEFYSLGRLKITESGITHIPETNLKELICVDCEYLTSIPRLPKLEYLECSNCPFLFINKELRHLTRFKSKNIGINIKNYIKKFQRKYLFTPLKI